MTGSIRRQTALLLATLLAMVGLATMPADARTGDGTRLSAIVSLTSEASADVLNGVSVVSDLPRLGMVAVNGTAAALSMLRGREGVRGVTPDYTLRPTSKTDATPVGTSVFASDNLGGGAGETGSGAGVTVAVVDSGISDTAALNRASGRLHDGVDTSDSGQDFNDRFGHGTFMANLVAGGAAPGSNGRALGVAPAAKVVNVKVADQKGETSLTEVLAGFSWVHAFSDRIDVVEFAFSGERPAGAYGPDPLTDAVERLRAAGLVVAVSSGNTTATLGDPGFDPYALTIGAADTRDNANVVAGFSGYGDVHGVTKPDVVASGVSMLSLMPANSRIARSNRQSLQPNGLYRGSGTSQATAVAAGVAALVIEDFPLATPSEVKAAVRASTVPVAGIGGGRGLLRTPTALVPVANEAELAIATGEASLDVAAWLSNSWLEGAWLEDTASRWAASRWAAEDWNASRWGASRWAASRWAASRWAVDDWSASRWGASRWGASRWGASRWAQNSWSAHNWS